MSVPTINSLRIRMFSRLLLRATTVRRGRTLTALLALAIAAAVATALLNLYVDLDAKLNTEFHKFGANVVVVANNGRSLSAYDIQSAEEALSPADLAVPFAYAVAKTT